MKNLQQYIESGVLELYVLGITTAEEFEEVEQMMVISPEIRKEINAIEIALERYAKSYSIIPNATIRPFVMATIDFSERMKNGENLPLPPALHKGSQIEEYNEWLNRSGMIVPVDFKDLHARIIGYTQEVLTAIVWIKDMAPSEVHDDEYEKFLIIEGSCDIMIEGDIHSLLPGDFFSIPLYKPHEVHVTSKIPCKVILQRVAA